MFDHGSIVAAFSIKTWYFPNLFLFTSLLHGESVIDNIIGHYFEYFEVPRVMFAHNPKY